MAQPFAFWKTSSAVFDPATLSLTFWVRAAFSSSPWTGTASAGGSGSRDATGITSHTPSSGNALNGLNVANWDNWATGQGFTNATAISTLLSASAWSFSGLIYVGTAHNNNASSFNNDPVWEDTGAFAGCFIKANGGSPLFQAYQWDGAEKKAEASISTGAWTSVQAKYDGTNIKCRVNGGSWASTAAGNISTTTGTLIMGNSSTAGTGNSFDGRMADFLMAASALSDANMDNIKSYYNSRYGLSL